VAKRLNFVRRVARKHRYCADGIGRKIGSPYNLNRLLFLNGWDGAALDLQSIGGGSLTIGSICRQMI